MDKKTCSRAIWWQSSGRAQGLAPYSSSPRTSACCTRPLSALVESMSRSGLECDSRSSVKAQSSALPPIRRLRPRLSWPMLNTHARRLLRSRNTGRFVERRARSGRTARAEVDPAYLGWHQRFSRKRIRLKPRRPTNIDFSLQILEAMRGLADPGKPRLDRYLLHGSSRVADAGTSSSRYYHHKNAGCRGPDADC